MKNLLFGITLIYKKTCKQKKLIKYKAHDLYSVDLIWSFILLYIEITSDTFARAYKIVAQNLKCWMLSSK
jgi:hypothetical protein